MYIALSRTFLFHIIFHLVFHISPPTSLRWAVRLVAAAAAPRGGAADDADAVRLSDELLIVFRGLAAAARGTEEVCEGVRAVLAAGPGGAPPAAAELSLLLLLALGDGLQDRGQLAAAAAADAGGRRH
eukprot:gene2529-17021_t